MKRLFLTTLTSLFVAAALAQTDSIDYNCFNNTEVRVVLQSKSFLSGEKVEAQIVLIQNDSNSKAKASIKEGETIIFNNGKANYTTIAYGEGKHEIAGYVCYYVGSMCKKISFKKEYTVYNSKAIVIATHMNVLYIGLDNPISISVPGFAPEKITVAMSGGILKKKSNSNYIARVKRRGQVKINVSVKLDDGSVKSMGSTFFRARKMPKPVAEFGTLRNGNTSSVSTIRANANRISGSLGEGFAYEGIKYLVRNFVFLYVPRKGETTTINCSGQNLNSEAKNLVRNMKSGDRILIEQIRAFGPDGLRILEPIIITAK